MRKINWIWVFVGIFGVMLLLCAFGLIGVQTLIWPVIIIWLIIIFELVKMFIKEIL